MKPLAKMTPAERQKRIAALVANPGTRSAVPDKYLPAQYRQQREQNTRLNAPVVQGSQLTNRDLARSANSQVAVKYGDPERLANQAVGTSQQSARDQAGWYDEYLKQLGQHATNIQGIGRDAVTGVQSLANAQPAPDTTGLSGDNARDATNAATVRKASLGSYGSMLTAQGANANTYADTLAHVVGPGQKLTAQSQAAGATRKAQDALASLVKEKGAYKDQLLSQGVIDEQKNVLANKVLGLNETKANTAAAAGRATRRETKAYHRTQAQIQKDRLQQQKDTAAGKINAYGYTSKDWAALTTTERQKVIKDFKANGSKPKSGFLPQASQNTFKDQFDGARTQVESRKALGETRPEVAALLKSGRPAQTVDHNGTKVKVPAIPKITNQDALTAALDAVFDQHLAPATVKKLHGRKIKVNQLGVSTKRPPAPTPVPAAVAAPVLTPSGVVPLGPVGP